MNIIRTRIIAALKMGVRSVAVLEKLAFTSQRNVLHHIKQLREAGQIHVARWQRGATGPFRPIYRWGPGTDAERPTPLSAAEVCKAYRARQRLQYGVNYNKVRQAQKKHIPGRRLVVDGAVVYQQ